MRLTLPTDREITYYAGVERLPFVEDDAEDLIVNARGRRVVEALRTDVDADHHDFDDVPPPGWARSRR